MASLAAAAAAAEHAETMEQVEGEERVGDAAAVEERMEGVGQVGVEETAEAPAEEGEGKAAADDEPVEAMEQVDGEERAEIHAEVEVEAGAPAEEEAEAEAAAEEDMEEEEEEEEEEEAGAAAAEDRTEAMEEAEALRTALPLGRVKKIIRVDRDIRKVTAEASLLIAAATELFLGSLAAGAHTAVALRGRRAVRAAHVRAAARAHRPTADFLLDCLLSAEEAPRACSAAGSGATAAAAEPKPLPRGTRRIDAFFQKAT